MPVPVAIAEMNGSLKTGHKIVLLKTLTESIICSKSITVGGNSCLIVDGQAQVGKSDWKASKSFYIRTDG